MGELQNTNLRPDEKDDKIIRGLSETKRFIARLGSLERQGVLSNERDEQNRLNKAAGTDKLGHRPL